MEPCGNVWNPSGMREQLGNEIRFRVSDGAGFVTGAVQSLFFVHVNDTDPVTGS